MSSTFLGLNTAYTGLQAANAALNTTANNISNAETKGYSRQQVNTAAADSIRSFTTYGCIGAGVETLSIERVRDSFYDEKYWANNSKLGEYDVKKYYMACIERYYTDDDSIKGFNSIFTSFSDTLQELAKNPNDTTVKQQTLGYAQNLATYFNDMYSTLQNMQSDVNQEIKVNIDRINAIAQEVAALNKQINVIEMNSSAMANELRDERDMLIDELSEIVSVEVDETPIIDLNDTSRDTGGTRYRVSVAGQNIIDGNDFRTFICVPRENYEGINQTDITGLYDIYFDMGDKWTNAMYREKGDELNVYSSTLGGKLAGLIAIRDGNNGENFKGVVAADGVDTGKQTVTVDVDADYLVDLDKLNLTPNGGTITIANIDYYYSEWSYSYDEDTSKCQFTFQLDSNLNKKLHGDVGIGPATMRSGVAIGPSIKYQGIPYYMSQMNEWVRKYAFKVNEIEKDGVLDDGTVGTELFNCLTPSGTPHKFTESYVKTGNSGNVIKLSSAADSYYMLTGGNIRVNSDLVTNPQLLATRSLQYTGADHNDIVKRLINLSTNDDPAKGGMNFRGCSADQYLVSMLSDVALNAERANNFTESYTILKNSIGNQRLSVNGVDNDEEAVNLTKYQQQYNLASKMIQVLTEVYDRLILQTGV